MTPEQFLELATKHKLGHVGKELLSTAIPSIRVLQEALRETRLGEKTYLGGAPSPMPQDWPTHKNTLLTFVAQLETETIPPDVCPVELPVGVLQFFVPSTSEANDYIEPSLDCGRVIFVPEGIATENASDGNVKTETERKSAVSRFLDLFKPKQATNPKTASSFPKRSFDWEVFPTIYTVAPDQDSIWLPENALDFEFNFGADEEKYFDFREKVMSSDWRLQMFGFADELQEHMEPAVDNASGLRSENVYREWVLLFALNSACGGLAPETVCYYFWIHRDDLTSGKFDEVWMCSQQD